MRRAAAVAGCASGVLVLSWASDVLRLHAGSQPVVFAAIIAFAAARASGTTVGSTAAGLALGGTAGVIAPFASAAILPLEPVGTGIGLGVFAAVVASAVQLGRGTFAAAPSASGFGAGVAAALLSGVSATTGARDVVSAALATLLAFGLGLLAAESTLHRVPTVKLPHRTRPEEVFGPVLRPPAERRTA